MYRVTLFLLIICSLSLGIQAQPISTSFTHLGIENGLSNNYVTALTQDKRGCIWMATESGLNQYDGYNITTYNSINSDLKQEAISTLFYDRNEDKIWIGGKFHGFYVLDCQTYRFHYYKEIQKQTINDIGSISAAYDGGIWLVAYDGAIIHYRKNKFTFVSPRNSHLINHEKRCIFDDGLNHIYIGYGRDGLDIIDMKTRNRQHFVHIPGQAESLPGNSVYTVCKDSKNNIWIGTNQGLALFNPLSHTFTTFRHDAGNPYSIAADHIYDIEEMNNGELWIASDIGGISILNINDLTLKNPKDIRFRNILPVNKPGGLSSGNIRSLLQDRTGNIWIGNYGSGVDFICHRHPVFTTLPYLTSGQYPKHKPVWGLCLDNKGRLWAGSENEITRFKDDKPVETINISQALSRPYGQVFSIIDADDGHLLLGIFDDGLLSYNIQNRQIIRLPLEKSYTDVITFYKDYDHSIWIGTENGLYHYSKGKIQKSPLNNFLYDKSVYGIVRDRQGKLWIGSYSSGLTVFDKQNHLISRLEEKNGFFSNAVNYLTMDSKGSIWIATRKGLGYIPDTGQPDKFLHYSYREGLADNYIRSIREDKTGIIWVSTNNGISRWDNHRKQFDNYNFRDGIPLGNFIEGSSVMAADGTLYFGSLNGICRFNPEQVLKKIQVPSLQIIACKELQSQNDTHDKTLIIPIQKGGIELPHDHNSFQITFSVPDYALSKELEYAYQIEGFDNKWISSGDDNVVTFRNLSYGHYTFKVKARLKNQTWDEASITQLKIHIKPPFWLAWYAIASYILLIFIITARGLRLYKRRLQLKSDLEIEKKKNENEQEMNEERLRFYTNITHELRTPLTLILGPLEDLTNDNQLPSGYRPRIKVIYNSARQLLNLINQLLEFRKAETQNRKLTVAKDNLSQLVREIGLRFKELNRNVNVQFNMDIATEGMTFYFDREVITTILNNLLSNAVKYTPEGSINLILRLVGTNSDLQYAEIIVSDTGYGIDKEALPHIFDRYFQAKGKHQASGTGIGLALVRSLVHLHKGLLHVESVPGKGTTFTLRLNTNESYPEALHKEREDYAPQQLTEPVPADTTDKRTIVLIVEDNDDIRDYIASSFDRSYKVLKAANGKEGWELAEKNIPDIIISDIMMPVMDGIELCRKVKEDIRTSHIPIVLLTAKDSIQDKEEGYDNGADSYLTKPFSAKLLLSRVRNLLENRRKIAEIIAGKTLGFQLQQPETHPNGLNKVSEEFLKKFVTEVEENITKEELDMPFMAEKMNMSHSTLYRKIKGLTGCSGNEYIRKIKLNYSIRLMTDKGMTISEAAYNSGFNDLSYYRRCFKKEYGQLPSEYIKKYLN